MRALTVSTLVLTLSALVGCSAEPEGTPPRETGGGSSTAGAAGSVNGFGGGAPASGGANSGFGGSPASAGSTNGFGGATAAAGSTGSAGAGPTTGLCAMTKVGAGSDGLIDNFETHPTTALIPATDNRVGGWWISMSATGTVTTPTIPKTGGGPMPVSGGMGGGMALHIVGNDTDKAMGWGADASVAITGTGSCYDASAYTGGIKISLMGKGSVYVSVITAQNKAASATSGNQRTEIAIDSTWKDYTIPWAMLKTGWGTDIPLDPKSIVALDISPSATSAFDFDIWIDNLSFYK